MEYLNRFKSTVSSVAAQVSQALPGNPIFREYDVQGQIASAGPGLSWKIFAGSKHTTKQNVAIWLFEKKQLDRWPKAERESIMELLRRGVSQLTRLRHPRLLVVERVLEESRDSLAFCTEPIFLSLANVFGDRENLAECPPQLDNFAFEDVEIRHGLFQLAEALTFLHNDAKMLHRNLSPGAVVVNTKGAWKLAGFDFCVPGVPDGTGRLVCEPLLWDRSGSALLMPVLDFAAPELVDGEKCDYSVDVFSLGLLAASAFNKNKPVIHSRGLLDAYKKSLDKLSFSTNSHQVPDSFKDDLKSCLSVRPDLRPDAFELTKVAYFDVVSLKALNYLDSLMQMDNSQKMQFFKGLPTVLVQFPSRPLLQKVMPALSGEFNTLDLIPFVLPSVFYIAEQVSDSEFADVVLPALIPVFRVQRPYQVVLLLLQQMPLLLKKTPDQAIKSHVLPMIYNSISNENTRIQELCLAIVPNVGKLVDRDAMRSQLLPKLLKLVLEGNVLSIRVLTLICLSKLLPSLEPWMVSDQLLPALPKVNSKEPAILMAILGIYKLAADSTKFGIGRELCARSVLPFLISSSIENTLNLQQYEQFVSLIRELMERVEKEQKGRLQQLSAGQEEQRGIGGDFNEIFSKAERSATQSPNLDDLAKVLDARPNRTPTAHNGSAAKPALLSDMDIFGFSRPTQPSPSPSTSTTALRPPNIAAAAMPNLSDFDPFGAKPSSTFQANFPTSIQPPPSATNPLTRPQPTNAFAQLPTNRTNQKDPFADLFPIKPAALQQPSLVQPMKSTETQPKQSADHLLDFLN